MRREFLKNEPMCVLCISAGRPQNTHLVQKVFGRVSFVVPPEQKKEYDSYTSCPVIGTGSASNCAEARNAALEVAFRQRLPCLMLDDDPIGEGARADLFGGSQPATVEGILAEMHFRLLTTDFRMAALTHLTNAFYVSTTISTTAVINGGALLILPNELRFDERLPLNSDVDYGLQHIERYGGALRCNDLLLPFRRGNRGNDGVARYRNQRLRIETVEYLRQKWPEWVHSGTDPGHPVVRVPRMRSREL